MHAVIKTGGKLYRVKQGQTLMVEKLNQTPGTSVELGEVLMIIDGDKTHIGQPLVKGYAKDHLSAVLGYGRHLGTAFQLIDDVLDYSQNAEMTGKNPGNDLTQGKVTLPLLHLLQQCSKEEQENIRQMIFDKNQDKAFIKIQSLIENSGAIPYTRQKAAIESEKAKSALSELPESPFKAGASALADFAINRLY